MLRGMNFQFHSLISWEPEELEVKSITNGPRLNQSCLRNEASIKKQKGRFGELIGWETRTFLHATRPSHELQKDRNSFVRGHALLSLQLAVAWYPFISLVINQ